MDKLSRRNPFGRAEVADLSEKDVSIPTVPTRDPRASCSTFVSRTSGPVRECTYKNENHRNSHEGANEVKSGASFAFRGFAMHNLILELDRTLDCQAIQYHTLPRQDGCTETRSQGPTGLSDESIRTGTPRCMSFDRKRCGTSITTLLTSSEFVRAAEITRPRLDRQRGPTDPIHTCQRANNTTAQPNTKTSPSDERQES